MIAFAQLLCCSFSRACSTARRAFRDDHRTWVGVGERGLSAGRLLIRIRKKVGGVRSREAGPAGAPGGGQRAGEPVGVQRQDGEGGQCGGAVAPGRRQRPFQAVVLCRQHPQRRERSLSPPRARQAPCSTVPTSQCTPLHLVSCPSFKCPECHRSTRRAFESAHRETQEHSGEL